MTYREVKQEQEALGTWEGPDVGRFWRAYVREYNHTVAESLPVVVTVKLATLLIPRNEPDPVRRFGPRAWRFLDHPWDKPCVYVIWRHDGEILYIGFSSNPLKRIQQHWGNRRCPSAIGTYLRNFGRKAPDWPVDLYPVRSRKEGLALEARMIDQYQPPLNIASAA